MGQGVRGCSARAGVTKGRKDWDGPLASTVRPRPKGFGVPLRDKAMTSSRSTRSTLAHICFHISSDILGPGSAPPVSQDGEAKGVGLLCLLRGEEDTRYRTIPIVLGKAYSLAITSSCAWREDCSATRVPRRNWA